MESLNKNELLALTRTAKNKLARLKNLTSLTMEEAQVELQKLEAILNDLEEKLKTGS